MPIWAKLGLIMLVPTLATIVVGVTGLVAQVDTVDLADRARTFANVNSEAGALTHELQEERAKTVMLLGGIAATKEERQAALSAFDQVVPRTEKATSDYLQQVQSLSTSSLPPNFTNKLELVTQGLQQLGPNREATRNNKGQASEVAQSYTVIITYLNEIRDFTAQLAGDTALSERMQAGAELARYKEFQAQKRILILTAFSGGEMTSQLNRDYIA